MAMATSLSSSTVFATSPSYSSWSPEAKGFVNSALLSSLSHGCSSHRPISRRLYRVQATVVKENAKKVKVEESFRSKGFPNDEWKGSHVQTPESSPSTASESWVVKLEQSINIFLTDSVIKILDTLYHDRDYARFFVLETIARVPYFAFMSVLHMYESFGWWRRADYLKVHFAESWNEMHHLLIMEELGGNAWWFDRFLAQHIAIFYYFMTAAMYALSPRMAYHFSECVESHAFETYDKFIKAQGEELKKLPAPIVAVKYYTEGDLYLFDEFQTSRAPNSRRPKIGESLALSLSLSLSLYLYLYLSMWFIHYIRFALFADNLYDVFVNIRDDEAEHCKTMKACQTHGNLRSPHSSSITDDITCEREEEEDDSGCRVPPQAADCEGIVDCITKSVSQQQAQTTQK